MRLSPRPYCEDPCIGRPLPYPSSSRGRCSARDEHSCEPSACGSYTYALQLSWPLCMDVLSAGDQAHGVGNRNREDSYKILTLLINSQFKLNSACSPRTMSPFDRASRLASSATNKKSRWLEERQDG